MESLEPVATVTSWLPPPAELTPAGSVGPQLVVGGLVVGGLEGTVVETDGVRAAAAGVGLATDVDDRVRAVEVGAVEVGAVELGSVAGSSPALKGVGPETVEADEPPLELLGIVSVATAAGGDPRTSASGMTAPATRSPERTMTVGR
ncbi:MAG: hypothetical protein ACRDYC_13585 [Acidimicrobiales bacterium]